MKDRPILVTGATGYIGKRLLPVLLEQGHKVTCAVRDRRRMEEYLGRVAEKNMLPLQPGDVPDTWADVEDLANDVGYRPSTPVEEGVKKFVDWYLEYYGS